MKYLQIFGFLTLNLVAPCLAEDLPATQNTFLSRVEIDADSPKIDPHAEDLGLFNSFKGVVSFTIVPTTTCDEKFAGMYLNGPSSYEVLAVHDTLICDVKELPLQRVRHTVFFEYPNLTINDCVYEVTGENGKFNLSKKSCRRDD